MAQKFQRIKIKVQNTDLFDGKKEKTGHLVMANNIKMYVPFDEETEVPMPVCHALESAISTIWLQKTRDKKMEGVKKPRFSVIRLSEPFWAAGEEPKEEKEIPATRATPHQDALAAAGMA